MTTCFYHSASILKQIADMQNQMNSWLKRSLTALAMTLAAVSAHATTSDTTLGNTRTITENFDGGPFINGNFNTPFSSDDYLRLNTGLRGINQTATLSFATAAASTATLNFYYAFLGSTPATVSLDGYTWSLGQTNDVLGVSLINPGVSSLLASTPFSSVPEVLALTAGQHTLTFSTGSGSIRTLKVDDIKITLSVPEPETYAMLLAGLGLLGAVAKRRKQR